MPKRKVLFMNSINKNSVELSLKKLAKIEGITTDEVRKEIALAISYALKSNDTKVQNFWQKVPCEGDAPTVDEVINFLAIQLATQNKNK